MLPIVPISPPSTSPSPTFHVCVFMTDHFVITSQPHHPNYTTHLHSRDNNSISPLIPLTAAVLLTPSPAHAASTKIVNSKEDFIHSNLENSFFGNLFCVKTSFHLRWGERLACNTILCVSISRLILRVDEFTIPIKRGKLPPKPSFLALLPLATGVFSFKKHGTSLEAGVILIILSTMIINTPTRSIFVIIELSQF